MDKWTRYSFIGIYVIIFLLGVVVGGLQRQAGQIDRWLDQNQKQIDHLEKAAPWMDDVERLLDRVLPEKDKDAKPTG